MKSELLFLFETHQVSSSKCICSMRVATGSCLCTLAPIRQMSLTRWDCIISASRQSWVGVPMNAGLLLDGRFGRVPEGTCGETTAFPFKGRNGSSNPHLQIKHKANWPPWLRPDLKGDVLVGYVEGDSCLFCVISIHRLNAQHCSRRRFRAPISQLKPLRTESLLVEIIYVILSLTQDKYLSSLTIYKCNSISDLEGENGVSVDKFIHFNQAICFK